MTLNRLLRGQWLYLILGTIIVLLYMRAMHVMRVAAERRVLDPQTAHLFVEEVEEPAVLETEAEDDAYSLLPKQIKRIELMRKAQRDPTLAFSLMFLSLFTIGMGAGGLSLTIWWLFRGQLWRIFFQYPSRRLPHWTFGEFGRLFILVIMVFSLMTLIRFVIPPSEFVFNPNSRLWIPLSMLVVHMVLVFAAFSFAHGKSRSPWKAFGLANRKRVIPSIEIGFRGYVAVFPWMFIFLYVIVWLMQVFDIKPPLEPIQELLFKEKDPRVIGMTVLLACVIGPIGEEIFFRGVFYPALRKRVSRTKAMLISGATFSLIHSNPVGFLPIMLIGCLLANLYERTGSLASPLAVHILHNTFLMSMALLMRRILLIE